MDGEILRALTFGMQNIAYAVLLVLTLLELGHCLLTALYQKRWYACDELRYINGKWASRGRKPYSRGNSCSELLLACHLYIMFGMQSIIYS